MDASWLPAMPISADTRSVIQAALAGLLVGMLLNAYLCYRWWKYMTAFDIVEDYVNNPDNHV